MLNRDRVYNYVTTTLLAAFASAAANLTTLTAANTALTGDQAQYVAAGTWPLGDGQSGFKNTLFGEFTTVFDRNNGTPTPNSSMSPSGNNASLRWFTTTTHATARGTLPAQCGLILYLNFGATIQQVTVNGPASAGIGHFGDTDTRVDTCAVNYSLADGNYRSCTYAICQNQETCYTTVTGSGDDYFSVVSAQGTPQASNILTHHCIGKTQQATGRGLTSVGGVNVTFRLNTASDCQYRGMYVASESSFTSNGNNNVLYDQNVIDGTQNGGEGAYVSSYNASWPNVNIAWKSCTVKRCAGALTGQSGAFNNSPDFSGVAAG